MAWNFAGLPVTAVKAAATSSVCHLTLPDSGNPVDIHCKFVKVDVWNRTLREREGEQVGAVFHFDRFLLPLGCSMYGPELTTVQAIGEVGWISLMSRLKTVGGQAHQQPVISPRSGQHST
jgi:hypothetical protein